LGNKENFDVAAGFGVTKTRLWLTVGAVALAGASGAVAQDKGQSSPPPQQAPVNTANSLKLP
jgi:hypothetical protein